jgi:hypothetical protein
LAWEDRWKVELHKRKKGEKKMIAKLLLIIAVVIALIYACVDVLPSGVSIFKEPPYLDAIPRSSNF